VSLLWAAGVGTLGAAMRVAGQGHRQMGDRDRCLAASPDGHWKRSANRIHRNPTRTLPVVSLESREYPCELPNANGLRFGIHHCRAYCVEDCPLNGVSQALRHMSRA
jgi:hypothetical protein